MLINFRETSIFSVVCLNFGDEYISEGPSDDFAAPSAVDGVEDGSQEPSSPAEHVEISVQLDQFADADLDRCVESALMSLPTAVPKPIWQEGVWSAIFGNGLLIDLDYCVTECAKPAAAPCLDAWLDQIKDCSLALKRSIPVASTDSFADVVRHVPIRTWEEERESILQSALKRWLMVVTSFSSSCTIYQQLSVQLEDVDKLTVLADVFRGKAPATLL